MAKDKKETTGFKTTLVKGRDTKGTFVYATTDEDPKAAPIRSLYISRTAFKGDPPEKITVTVEGA